MSDNGLVGGIKNVWLRRLALIFVAIPLTVCGLAVPYARVLPIAFAQAWCAFAEVYRRPNALNALAFKSAWSKDWKPV